MTFSKKMIAVTKSFVISMLLTQLLDARVGESEAQCVERYGKEIYTLKHEGLVGKIYTFNGRDIRVIFMDGVSSWEAMTFGPEAAPTEQEQRQKHLSALKFTKALLSSVYKFTDAELAPLPFLNIDTQTRSSSMVTNGKIAASYRLEVFPVNDTITAKIFIVDGSKDTVALGKAHDAISRDLLEKSKNKQVEGF